MNSHKRATLYDVASRAGVSSQTVSRVINAHPNVATKTRNRVLRAIEELSYQPNRAAQSLKTKRSHTLEVITFEVGYPYSAPAMVSKAKELGYKLMFSVVDPSSQTELHEALDEVSGRLTDGVVIITPGLNVNHEELMRLYRGIPLVLMDTYLGAQVPSVVVDQRLGSQLATQHLIDLGHRKIAEISGPLSQLIDPWERHESWQKTMAANGLEPGSSVEGDFTVAGGHSATHRLLASGADFSALVTGDDLMAVGAIHALRERGLRVPEDVSLVGFDDMEAAPYIAPPLTTVRQDFNALGIQAIDYLVALIEQPNTPLHQRVLYPELVVRQSTRRLDNAGH
jgi:LacI family transcriptional regulator